MDNSSRRAAISR